MECQVDRTKVQGMIGDSHSRHFYACSNPNCPGPQFDGDNHCGITGKAIPAPGGKDGWDDE